MLNKNNRILFLTRKDNVSTIYSSRSSRYFKWVDCFPETVEFQDGVRTLGQEGAACLDAHTEVSEDTLYRPTKGQINDE